MQSESTATGTTLRLPSQVRGGAGAELIEDVRRLLHRGERRILLDLSQVEHIDSHGVGMLVSAWRMTAAEEATLILSDLSPPARATLKMVGLLEMFPEITPPPDQRESP
ncbi:STAS domain-containing protein [Candidatus Sumerlaeota bacterium]|nr:STAS domain-containing protein [Candidatus Sumerlaeota bacterium]